MLCDGFDLLRLYTNLYYSLFYLVLGILAIFSAIRYTVGNTAWVSRLWNLFVLFSLV
jgi:1,4-dihydroxy-2-naphthoate octaprenyltransferase